MHVFYSEERKGNLLILDSEEVKHFKVRRIRKDEEFGVIYEGKIYLCKYKKEEKGKILCEIIGEYETFIPKKEIFLYQCITVDLKTMDLIVRQATELGVSKFIPVISERSFTKMEAIEKRIEKWKKIVKEAMKQSRRPIPMEIYEPVNLTDIIPSCEENIFLDNFSKENLLKDVNLKAESFSVIVGPEGGFSEREVKYLKEKGFKPLFLETYTLRSETASVSICSVILNCNT